MKRLWLGLACLLLLAGTGYADITTNLVAHWKFDNSGADDTVNGHTATLNGGATYSTSSKVGTHTLSVTGGGRTTLHSAW